MDVEGSMQAIHGSIILPSYVKLTNPVGGEKHKNTQAEKISATYLSNLLVIYL